MQLFPAALAATTTAAPLAINAAGASFLASAPAAAASAAPLAGLAGLGDTLGLLGSGIQAIGTIASGRQAEAYGRTQKQIADLEASELEAAGKEEFAEKQREMLALRRNKRLALSQLTNRAAGSGFSADDPTTLAIADEIEKYGTIQEQTALYGGESRRRAYDSAAAGRRFEGEAYASSGRAAKRGSYLSAASTIMGGISTMADRYAPRRSSRSTLRYG